MAEDQKEVEVNEDLEEQGPVSLSEADESFATEGSIMYMVHSMVRRPETRAKRMVTPTKHRFKQYLFHDPSKRLIRNRPLRITAEELQNNLEYLREAEDRGILQVRSLDGRLFDLSSLKLSVLPPPEPLPQFPMDSVERDTPQGISMANLPGGVPFTDPAARALSEKLAEQHRAQSEQQTEYPTQPEPARPLPETEIARWRLDPNYIPILSETDIPMARATTNALPGVASHMTEEEGSKLAIETEAAVASAAAGNYPPDADIPPARPMTDASPQDILESEEKGEEPAPDDLWEDPAALRPSDEQLPVDAPASPSTHKKKKGKK